LATTVIASLHPDGSLDMINCGHVRPALVCGGKVVRPEEGNLPVGLLPIAVHPEGTATLTGGTPTLGPELDPAPLLATAGLGPADHEGPPPRAAGCGLEFPYLPVRRRWLCVAASTLTAVTGSSSR